MEVYENVLECKSNAKFLPTIDPQKIIKGFPAEFVTCKDGKYSFHSRGVPIHQAITKLSRKYPEEEFILKTWNSDIFRSAMRTITYKGGDSIIKKVEPNFFYVYNSRLKFAIGKDRFNVFFVIIKSFFDKLKDVTCEEWLESEDAIVIRKPYEISIQLEDEEFRILATRDNYSHIRIEGFKKVHSQISWQLIDEYSFIPKILLGNDTIENEYYDYKNDNDNDNEDDYDPLPF